jgi:hypothetical protein
MSVALIILEFFTFFINLISMKARLNPNPMARTSYLVSPILDTFLKKWNDSILVKRNCFGLVTSKKVVFQGLASLARERPRDPIEYLAGYLIRKELASINVYQS